MDNLTDLTVLALAASKCKEDMDRRLLKLRRHLEINMAVSGKMTVTQRPSTEAILATLTPEERHGAVVVSSDLVLLDPICSQVRE